MNITDNIDLKGIIMASAAGVVISLVIGLILFWLTFGSVLSYDGGIFSTGYTEISFIAGVFVGIFII